MLQSPIALFHRWYGEARRHGIPLYDAMALATADRRGRPSVRYVLLKESGPRGFVFYTNEQSRKGRELLSNPRGALAFYWDALGKQVRIEGRVRRVTPREADAYWRTRPRESQLGAVLSRQSEPLHSPRGLEEVFRKLDRLYRGRVIERPPHWTGFRVIPDRIEFWIRGEHRLHRRDLYEKRGGRWNHVRLQP